MQFPTWIDSARNSPTKRAQLRLKYMLSLATLNRFGRTSMHDLAREIGCNHSSIFNAINRGYFTDEMAERISKVVKLPPEHLVKPLEVNQGL